VADLDQLKAEIKKLSSQAIQAKMDLHDLSEELLIDWQRVPEVAQRAHEIYKELEQKRTLLKTSGA